MQIGRQARSQTEGLVALLLECHQRIRFFLELAARLSASEAPSEDEIRDAAGRVRRYFGEALPLHVEDEEQSLLPRLWGHDPALDVALAQMSDEHREHVAGIARMVSLCGEIESSPARLEPLRGELAAVATSLGRGLRAHLAHEEELIVPAIDRWMGVEEQAAAVSELRARRAAGP